MSKNKNLFVFIVVLSSLIVLSFSQNCTDYLNFCSVCDEETNLCIKCTYPDIMKPDSEGGCTGIQKCTPEANFCKECDDSSYICKTCEEGYVPDDNGGCSKVENCFVSYKGYCKICKDEYILLDKEKEYLECVSVHSEELEHCVDYTIRGVCEKCEENFYVNYGDKRCSTTPDCFSSEKSICNKCSDYYYLDKKDKNQCKLQSTHEFNHCIESDDGEKCSKCDNYGHYLTKENLCASVNFCSVAEPLGNYCLECNEGLFLTPDKTACVASENCLKGSKNGGGCITCKTGFYLDKSDLKCKSNQENNDFRNCYKGNENQCEVCIDNFYLSEDIKCTSTPYCKEVDVEESGKCNTCSENYYLTQDGKKCTKVENCLTTGSNTGIFCEECITGMVLNKSDSSCVNEEKDESLKNCKTIDYVGEFCDGCRSDFYLNKNDFKCYSNNDKENEFFKCSQLSTENICEECEKGYYLGSLDNKCSAIMACAKSDGDPEKCAECEEGFCLDKKSGTCKGASLGEIESDQTGENKICYQCKQTNNEGTKCETCYEGFVLSEEGYCQELDSCTDTNDEGKCLKCKQNFYHDGWIHSYCLNSKYGCIKGVLSGCLKCENDSDFTDCTECLEGFYKQEGVNFCYECKEGCKTCTDGENCGGCKDGFYVIKDESEEGALDSECGKCSNGCKSCDNENSCKECFDGYFLTNEKSERGDLECYECSSRCIECQDENICLKCDEGLELTPQDDKIICKYE